MTGTKTIKVTPIPTGVSMSKEEDFGLVMPFVDQSESFAMGVECGRIYETMDCRKSFAQLIHKTNSRQIEMFAMRFSYTLTFDSVDNEWTQVIGTFQPSAYN